MSVIAILGASGQIGRSLALELAERSSHQLSLFARDTKRVAGFVEKHELPRDRISVHPIDDFGATEVEIIINAVGEGSRARQRDLGAKVFQVTEHFDNLILDYIRDRPEIPYFFLSSGAVYGFDAPWPVGNQGSFRYKVNCSKRDDHYPLAKIAAEAKHRCLKNLSIYDVRIFGYFSRFIEPDDSFFLSEVVRSITNGEVLETHNKDMVRDYISQKDLANLILPFIESKQKNGPYDVYSKEPVGKFELLDRLGREFGLKVVVNGGEAPRPLKIQKPARPSMLLSAEAAGYDPARTSLDNVVEEIRALEKMAQ